MSFSQKYAKIKKRDADIFVAGAGSATVAASTPVKPKSTPKRGHAKIAAAAATDDEEEKATPSKKIKKSTKKERKDSADDDEM